MQACAIPNAHSITYRTEPIPFPSTFPTLIPLLPPSPTLLNAPPLPPLTPRPPRPLPAYEKGWPNPYTYYILPSVT